MKSTNGNLILKPYEGVRKLEAKVSSGFATVKQKTNLIGLELLVDSEDYYKGTILYFLEETLYHRPWSKKVFECSEIEGKFIIGLASDVVAKAIK